jgi:hypothetical protein
LLELRERDNGLFLFVFVLPPRLRLFRLGRGFFGLGRTGVELLDRGDGVLDRKSVRSIRHLLAKGWTQAEIADRHDVSQSQVSNIARGRHWKEAP